MRVQRVLMPGSEAESWTVLGGDQVPVEPVERFLGYLTSIEKSPNTVKAYAHDLKDWFAYLTGHDLRWQAVTVEDVAGFVAWLRLPPEGRDGKVAVLPTVEHHCSAASVNRKLAALTSFCEFHARHGVELGRLLITMQPAGRPGSATSYKPFLHHVTKRGPQRRREIRLKTSRPGRRCSRRRRCRPSWTPATTCEIAFCSPFCWTAASGSARPSASGTRTWGSPSGPSPSSRGVTTTGPAPRPGRSRTVPASAELMRLYADYLTREYGSLDSDYVFVSLWSQPYGRPWTYAAVYDLVLRLRERTGIDFGPHCRRTD